MYNIIKYLAVIILLVAGAVWLADNPGSASLDWGGYRIEAPFSILLLAIVLFGIICAILYRIWLFLRRTPGLIGQSRQENRRRKGYLALTRGMVAVAAGDVNEAEKNAKQAESLLSDPPLTMLLSAQAAQLAGDETAAEKYFEAMAEKPEMAFLGLKGRLTQALKQEDKDTALQLARRAQSMRPKTDWANHTLFDLLVHKGEWTEAETLVRSALKNKLLTAPDANRRLSILLHEQTKAPSANQRTALKTAGKVLELAPTFVPGAQNLAALLVKAKRLNKAEEVLEEIWAKAPQASIVSQYMQIRPVPDPMKAILKVERLVNFNDSHEESAIARAEAALKAKLWGEARKYLAPYMEGNTSVRVCRMMAELEEEEHQDMTKSREWLRKASQADPDPAWVCNSCGSVVAVWAPICSKCNGFDTFEWQIPQSIFHLEKPSSETPPTTALPVTKGTSVQEVTESVDVKAPGE